MANLSITAKRIYSWEDKTKCNDCSEESFCRVKYPKLKAIDVCYDCYEEYYEHLIK